MSKPSPAIPKQKTEIEVVKQAQEAAKAGDASKALDFLKAAGNWTVDVAKSVAAELLEDAIKAARNVKSRAALQVTATET